jgi:hypothetical protein
MRANLYIYWAIIYKTNIVAPSARMECRKKLLPYSPWFSRQGRLIFRSVAWIMAIICADNR